jgi:hypothetical protein
MRGRLLVDVEIPDGPTIPEGTMVEDVGAEEMWIAGFGAVMLDDDEVYWLEDGES